MDTHRAVLTVSTYRERTSPGRLTAAVNAAGPPAAEGPGLTPGASPADMHPPVSARPPKAWQLTTATETMLTVY